MLSFDQTVQVTLWERMQWHEALCSDMWAVEAHFAKFMWVVSPPEVICISTNNRTISFAK